MTLRCVRFRPRYPSLARAAGAAALIGALLAPAASASGFAPISDQAREVVQWIARAHDSGNAPFLVVDKRSARLLVFDGRAQLQADAPVLLGAAKGDDSVPGIGERAIRDIRPFERTTPAGRFVAEAGRNAQGEDIVWVDYDVAVSMHRVRATNPRERRLQRLATPTIADNRISYGCINVPAKFFDAWVSPLFRDGRRTVIYVLPEVHSLASTFPGMRPDPTHGAPPV
jgi:hypothetical protein